MKYALFKVGSIWHYRFQIAGASTQRSTREVKKGPAGQVAERAYAEALAASRGRELAPTLADLARRWLAAHRPVLSVAHIRSVDTFARLHLYELGERLICDIDTGLVEAARNEHIATHAPASANHWLRILKLLMQWALARELLLAMPWRVKMLKVQKRPRAILPTRLVLPWLAALDAAASRDPSVGTAVRLMFGLGLRELEAAGARWSWLDWERRTYTPGKTKGREAEPVMVPDWMMDHLAALAGARGVGASPLIAPSRKGTMHKAGFARMAIRSANVACGIEGITPHRLRGTFATMLSESGVGVQDIQVQLRHKSAATTMHYLEKDASRTVKGQAAMAEKMGLRKNCEEAAAAPHKTSVSQ